jgi:hypothetical protein
MNSITFIIPTNGTEKVLTIDIDSWSHKVGKTIMGFFRHHCTDICHDVEAYEGGSVSINNDYGVYELKISGDNGCRTFESVETFCL